MDETRVRAMFEEYFALSREDPAAAHGMYHDDAVLEFPQSGERFEGVGNFREWRSDYPASTSFGDRIARETIYFAEPFEAPEWRAGWRAAP
jgi:hypothetical protein